MLATEIDTPSGYTVRDRLSGVVVAAVFDNGAILFGRGRPWRTADAMLAQAVADAVRAERPFIAVESQ